MLLSTKAKKTNCIGIIKHKKLKQQIPASIFTSHYDSVTHEQQVTHSCG